MCVYLGFPLLLEVDLGLLMSLRDGYLVGLSNRLKVNSVLKLKKDPLSSGTIGLDTGSSLSTLWSVIEGESFTLSHDGYVDALFVEPTDSGGFIVEMCPVGIVPSLVLIDGMMENTVPKDLMVVETVGSPFRDLISGGVASRVIEKGHIVNGPIITQMRLQGEIQMIKMETKSSMFEVGIGHAHLLFDGVSHRACWIMVAWWLRFNLNYEVFDVFVKMLYCSLTTWKVGLKWPCLRGNLGNTEIDLFGKMKELNRCWVRIGTVMLEQLRWSLMFGIRGVDIQLMIWFNGARNLQVGFVPIADNKNQVILVEIERRDAQIQWVITLLTDGPFYANGQSWFVNERIVVELTLTGQGKTYFLTCAKNVEMHKMGMLYPNFPGLVMQCHGFIDHFMFMSFRMDANVLHFDGNLNGKIDDVWDMFDYTADNLWDVRGSPTKLFSVTIAQGAVIETTLVYVFKKGLVVNAVDDGQVNWATENSFSKVCSFCWVRRSSCCLNGGSRKKLLLRILGSEPGGCTYFMNLA